MASKVIALIGLDWGSSQLRAYAFDANGAVIARRSSDHGAMTLSSAAAFGSALDEIVANDADWLAAPRLACGMVGARGAWVEAGYCQVGADANALALKLARVDTNDSQPLWVIPGIASDAPDVMRGEETQLLGAEIVSGTVILPGTHSKWATLASHRIDRFRTYVTGEMNALIRTHSTIGRTLVPTPQLEPTAIRDGVARARERGSFTSELFSFRARAVAQNESPQQLSNEFSAWLIATEFEDALRRDSSLGRVYLIGSDALVAWYRAIAELFGLNVEVLDADLCVTRGLWRIAVARGLVHPT